MHQCVCISGTTHCWKVKFRRFNSICLHLPFSMYSGDKNVPDRENFHVISLLFSPGNLCINFIFQEIISGDFRHCYCAVLVWFIFDGILIFWSEKHDNHNGSHKHFTRFLVLMRNEIKIRRLERYFGAQSFFVRNNHTLLASLFDSLDQSYTPFIWYNLNWLSHHMWTHNIVYELR